MPELTRGQAILMLGLSTNYPTEAEIKKAFKCVAAKFHPDVNGNDESKTERFLVLNNACILLTKAAKSLSYEAYKPEIRLPITHFSTKENFCVTDLELWNDLLGENDRKVTKEDCITYLFSILSIEETEENIEKLNNFINGHFMGKGTFLLLDKGMYFKASDINIFYFTALFSMKLNKGEPVGIFSETSMGQSIHFLTAFFTEMCSPYKIDLNGNLEKRCEAELAYQ